MVCALGGRWHALEQVVNMLPAFGSRAWQRAVYGVFWQLAQRSCEGA